MIRSHFIRVIIIFITTLILTGCFEMNADLKVHEDGTAEMVMNIGIDQQLYYMQPDSKRALLCDELGKGSKDMGRAEMYMARGRVFCRFRKQLGPIREISEKGLEITIESDGTVQLAVDFSELKGMGSNNARPRRADLEMLKAMLIGEIFRFRVYAPHIVSTNGLMAGDKTFAEMGIPAIEFLEAAETGKKLQVFITRFYCRENIFSKGC